MIAAVTAIWLYVIVLLPMLIYCGAGGNEGGGGTGAGISVALGGTGSGFERRDLRGFERV